MVDSKSEHNQMLLRDHIVGYLKGFDGDSGFNIKACYRYTENCDLFLTHEEN